MNEEEFGFETEAIRTQLERTQYLEHCTIVLNF
jgi:O-succinylhomoserine sulfhydrylase